MLIRGLMIAACAAALAGCASSQTTTARLPDGRVVVNVHSSDQNLTIATGNASTFVCTKRKCNPIATGGGVTNGASGIIGPALGVAAAAVAPSSGISIAHGATTAISSSKSKAGSGNSNVAVEVKSTNINVNDNAVRASNRNVGKNSN